MNPSVNCMTLQKIKPKHIFKTQKSYIYIYVLTRNSGSIIGLMSASFSTYDLPPAMKKMTNNSSAKTTSTDSKNMTYSTNGIKITKTHVGFVPENYVTYVEGG